MPPTSSFRRPGRHRILRRTYEDNFHPIDLQCDICQRRNKLFRLGPTLTPPQIFRCRANCVQHETDCGQCRPRFVQVWGVSLANIGATSVDIVRSYLNLRQAWPSSVQTLLKSLKVAEVGLRPIPMRLSPNVTNTMRGNFDRVLHNFQPNLTGA